MTAVLFVVLAWFGGLALGLAVGTQTARWERQDKRKADEAGQDAERDALVAQWRQGHDYGKEMGYRDGWTSGRLARVDEQQARRCHPTGSPLSELKALDAEADRRMKGID